MEIASLIALCIIGYMFGNINAAKILSWNVKNEDIATKGSGNPGTSNMLRTYGFRMAIVTFLIDVLKGTIPNLATYLIYRLAFQVNGNLIIIYSWIVGICAVIGHMYPIVLKFKGGKGIATACGVFFVMQPIIMCFIVLTGIIILLWVDIMSVVSLYAMSMFTFAYDIYMGITGMTNVWVYIMPIIIWIITVWAHRQNIKKLYNGTERKVNFKSRFSKEHLAEIKAEHQAKKQAKQNEKSAK